MKVKRTERKYYKHFLEGVSETYLSVSEDKIITQLDKDINVYNHVNRIVYDCKKQEYISVTLSLDCWLQIDNLDEVQKTKLVEITKGEYTTHQINAMKQFDDVKINTFDYFKYESKNPNNNSQLLKVINSESKEGDCYTINVNIKKEITVFMEISKPIYTSNFPISSVPSDMIVTDTLEIKDILSKSKDYMHKHTNIFKNGSN